MAFGDAVQANSAASNLATTTPTLGVATTAGNILVLAFSADDYNGTVTSGWTQSAEMEQQTVHGGYIWWLVATAGMTIPNYVIGSATRSVWTLVEYEGPFDVSPYDISEGQFQATSLTDVTYGPPNITPTAGDRLLVAAVHFQFSSTSGGSSLTSGWTNSFTERRDQLNGAVLPMLTTGQASRVVTANGSTAYSTTATVTGSSSSRSGLIISLKKGAAAASTPNKIIMPKQGIVRAAYW